MASTRASISKVSKRPKINIIPPKQLFVDLTQDDTKTPSPKLPNSSPSAPNAPSKTPSTKDTSSSSIDYIPKSPTSSTSPSPNGYLNPSTSPPPRVSPPPPTQDNASMDITLTLSPNTPLDVQFDTPSPSPPIIAHPIPWNFLEAHALGPSRKRSRSPSSPSYPDATTFLDDEPAASESPELNPKDLTARLEDIKVEIDTLHVDREDKEVLISKLQDSLTASEKEIAVLQLRVDDAEARQAEDHAQIQSILARLGL
ncbi:hypothetical protein Tco_0763146 [Tanacetum coccineum]